MTSINSFEQSVIEQIISRANVPMPFVRSKDTSKIAVVAARNGVIAFLYDQGWDDEEIAFELNQDLIYIQIVREKYQKDLTEKQIANLNRKIC